MGHLEAVEEVLNEISQHEGYTYAELKDVLDESEKNILIGMALAYNGLESYPVEIAEIESETLKQIKKELIESNLAEVQSYMKFLILETIISFEGNHPEE